MNKCNGAWTMVAQGQIAAITAGTDIPVIENIPAISNLNVYAVSVTNAGSGITYYTEPAARGGTANQGTPVPNTSSPGTTYHEFGPRDLKDVIANGNPQMRSGSGSVNVRFRIFVLSR